MQVCAAVFAILNDLLASSYNPRNLNTFKVLSTPQKFGYYAFSCFTLMKSVRFEDERRGDCVRSDNLCLMEGVFFTPHRPKVSLHKPPTHSL